MLRAVGGGAYGLGRVGMRAGGVALVFDTKDNELLAILPSASTFRIPASIGLAARYLSHPDARSVGLLGSGRNALPALRGICAVRRIERVFVYSPTAEHRETLARRATEALGIAVTPVESVARAVDGADIIAVATSSTAPVLTAEHLQPGVHVTSLGEPHELDGSVYLRADHVVASSWYQQMEGINPGGQRISQRKGLAPVPLWELLAEGRLSRDRLVELGAIVASSAPTPIGAADITVFLESQGGVGDVALANLFYERAKALGRGTRFTF